MVTVGQFWGTVGQGRAVEDAGLGDGLQPPGSSSPQPAGALAPRMKPQQKCSLAPGLSCLPRFLLVACSLLPGSWFC